MKFKYPNDRPQWSEKPSPDSRLVLDREISMADSRFEREMLQKKREVNDTYWSDLGYITSFAVAQCYTDNPLRTCTVAEAEKRQRRYVEEKRRKETEKASRRAESVAVDVERAA